MLVLQERGAKRKNMERNDLRIFYLHNCFLICNLPDIIIMVRFSPVQGVFAGILSNVPAASHSLEALNCPQNIRKT